MSKLTVVTAPTSEPVTLAELKDHLNVTGIFDDSYITFIGKAARQWIEATTWRSLITQTWDQYFDGFRTVMRLRNPPVASITSVKYTDTAGTQQTVDTDVYELGEVDGVGVVRLKYNQTWPAGIRGHADDVVVRYVAGYGKAASVPETLKHALKLLVGDLYEHRENTITGTIVGRIGTIDALLGPYRVRHDV